VWIANIDVLIQPSRSLVGNVLPLSSWYLEFGVCRYQSAHVCILHTVTGCLHIFASLLCTTARHLLLALLAAVDAAETSRERKVAGTPRGFTDADPFTRALTQGGQEGTKHVCACMERGLEPTRIQSRVQLLVESRFFFSFSLSFIYLFIYLYLIFSDLHCYWSCALAAQPVGRWGWSGEGTRISLCFSPFSAISD